MIRRILALLGAGLFSVAAFGQSPEYVPGRLLVGHLAGMEDAPLPRGLAQRGAKLTRKIGRLPVSVIEAADDQIDQLEIDLRASGQFQFVERDYYAHGSVQPNDPSFPGQWHLAKIAAPAAWDINRGSSGIIIAIVDSGVDGSHPDLSSKMVAGWNFVNNNSDTHDVLGHGTAVAGTAAAATDNATGVAGVTWMSKIMPLVALDSSNYATYSNIASAITYAADHGARVVSISIAGTMSSSTLQNAVDYAWNKGVLVVAAAGNSSSSSPNYPAACNNAIAVGATDSNDALASFSNYGNWVDVVAPGTYISTTNNGGGYGQWQGTSFSTPIVAGVAALALSANGSLSPSAVTSLLTQNADDLGSPGFDSAFGWGRVNAYRVLQAAGGAPSDTTAPLVSIGSPSNGTTVSGSVYITGSASDNVGVTRVEFYVDNVLKSTGSSASFSFPWTTTTAANGNHSIMVKAYDAANNSSTSSTTLNVSNVTVPPPSDTQAPVVYITSPAAGSTAPTALKIAVAATDNVRVTQVNIYVDSVLIASSTSSSATANWNTKKVASGNHTITATAVDAAGNVGSAFPVTFKVK
ncbi:MAG: S8 family serine peptidase [Bryobacteraceae bacterium]